MSFSAEVGRGAVWAIVGQATTALLGVVNFAVVGRFVGPGEYGKFILAMMVLSATQWLAQNAYKEPMVQSAKLDDRQIDSVFTFSVLVGSLLCLIMCSVALYFHYFKNESEVAICIVVLAFKLLLDAAVSVPLAMRTRKIDFKFLARVAICANLFGTGVNISMLLLGFGLTSLVSSQLAASALTIVTLFFFDPRSYRFGLQRGGLEVLRGYSPHVILWQGIEAVSQTVDRFFISARLSFTDLGLYGFGKRLNDVVIDVLVGAASNVALPAFSQLQNDRARLQAAFLKAMRMVTLMVLPVIAMLYATADDFVPLFFGPKWHGAVAVYRWFLLLGVIQTIGILQGGLLRSLWKPGTWTRYMLAQCIANVVVLSLLGGYGIEVMAAAIVIRAYTLWGWIVLQTCKALGLKPMFYVIELLKPIGISMAAVLASVLLRPALQDWNMFLRLVANGVIVGVVFCLLALIFVRPAIIEAWILGRSMLSRKLA